MRYLLSLLFVILLASPTFAAKTGKAEAPEPAGGFEGPVVSTETGTVAQIEKMPNDARIKLKGNLVSMLEDEKNIYLFKDATGQIEVRITPKQFQGQIVKPETPIQITGRIFKSENPDEAPRVRVVNLKVLN